MSMHLAWCQILQESHWIPRWLDLTGLLHMPHGCFQTGPGLGLTSPQRIRRPHRSPARVGDVFKMATPGRLLTLFRPENDIKKASSPIKW